MHAREMHRRQDRRRYRSGLAPTGREFVAVARAGNAPATRSPALPGGLAPPGCEWRDITMGLWATRLPFWERPPRELWRGWHGLSAGALRPRSRHRAGAGRPDERRSH